jgi:phage terminase large subunit
VAGEVLDAWVDPSKQRIRCRRASVPGKTTVESWCAWHFLSCFGDRGEHPKAVAFSITGDNLRDNLWPELSKWQDRSAYLKAAFTKNSERIFANHHPETWFLSARSWPKTASPTRWARPSPACTANTSRSSPTNPARFRCRFLRAADQVLATGPIFGKILQGGNPISLEGMLYAAATVLRHQWTVVRITGDPDDPHAWVHSPRVVEAAKRAGTQSPADWAREQIATYGRENPWVMAQILGHFPPSSLNALLGVDEVEQAMARHIRIDQYDWAQKRLGVDVARFGDDRTVIFPRQGLVAFRPKVMRHKRDSRGVDRHRVGRDRGQGGLGQRARDF